MSSNGDNDLPDGWEARKSRSTGLTYYLNIHNKKSQWEKPEAPARVQEVNCSHILVKHRGSRRPSSWREEKITRSYDDAMDIIQGYRKDIVDNKASFEEIASKYSDCSSAKRKGNLGPFGKGVMQKAFEEAAFSLMVGELSKVVETDSGLHLIVRIS